MTFVAKVEALYAKVAATKLGAIGIRIVVSGVSVGGAAFFTDAAATHLLSLPNFLNLSLWHEAARAAVVAGGTAIVAGIQSIFTTITKGAPQLFARSRAMFKMRRAALS